MTVPHTNKTNPTIDGLPEDATHASIKLIASFSNIILRIEDNGKGFNIQNYLDSAINEKQMGFLSMEERVSFLSNKMKIESNDQAGQKNLIEIPYKELNGG